MFAGDMDEWSRMLGSYGSVIRQIIDFAVAPSYGETKDKKGCWLLAVCFVFPH
jgi:hypothetical protein